jgi:transcriptional regulator with XRE-family HTH domain
MTFAEKLKELRLAAGLTEAALAEKADVKFTALREWATGRRAASFAAVVKLARALGTDCGAFAECSDVSEAPPKGAPVKKPANQESRKPRKK